MLDLSKYRLLHNPTVADIKKILDTLPDDAQFACCGDDYVHIHIEKDNSAISVDTDDLEEVYAEQTEESDDDTKYEVHLCPECITNLTEHFPYTIPREDLKIVEVSTAECDNNNLDHYSEVLSKRNKKYLDKHKT